MKKDMGECPDVQRQHSSTAHTERFKSQNLKKTDNEQKNEKKEASAS